MTSYFYADSCTARGWLTITTPRHVASFPTHTRVRGVAPDSNETFFRVAAVVLCFFYASVRIHIIVNKLMFVRRLGWPCLASSAVDCSSCLTRVIMSCLWRRAIICICNTTSLRSKLTWYQHKYSRTTDTTCAPQCIGMQPFLKSSQLLTMTLLQYLKNGWINFGLIRM